MASRQRTESVLRTNSPQGKDECPTCGTAVQSPTDKSHFFFDEGPGRWMCKGAPRTDDSLSPAGKGRRDVRSPASPASSPSSQLNSTRRSAASTVGRLSPNRDLLDATNERGASARTRGRPQSSIERDEKEERLPGSIVPKAFNEKDFEDFLARQTIRPPDGPLAAVMLNLRKAPMLPITGFAFRIQGGTYVERKKDAQPWRPQSASSFPPQPKEFDEFLRRNDGFARKLAQNSWTEPARRVVVSKERVEGFLERSTEGVHLRKIKIKKLLQDIRDETMGTKSGFAKRAKDAVRTPEGLARLMVQPDVEKPKRLWLQDVGGDVGESLIFPNRTTDPARVEAWYATAGVSPCVANRESAVRPTSGPSSGLKTFGDPYAGGKADAIRRALGKRAGLDLLPSSIE